MSYHDKISTEKLIDIFAGNLFPLGIVTGMIACIFLMKVASTKTSKKIGILKETGRIREKLASLHVAAKNASDSTKGVQTILDARDECQRGCAEIAYHLNEITKITKKL